MCRQMIQLFLMDCYMCKIDYEIKFFYFSIRESDEKQSLCISCRAEWKQY